VLQLDTGAASPAWRASTLQGGLQTRDAGRLFEPVLAVAARESDGGGVVLAGGPAGVFRSLDGAASFTAASQTRFEDAAPIPPGWLYSSGEHAVTVVFDDRDGA